MSLFAVAISRPSLAQHTDDGESDHGFSRGGSGGGAGGNNGGQHGRPEDRHSGEDDHGDDHGEDHTDDQTDDHGSDHASGGKGKGPKYKGGRDTVSVGVGHGRSLEDRVLKSPSF